MTSYLRSVLDHVDLPAVRLSASAGAALSVLLVAPLSVTGAGPTVRLTSSANVALRQLPQPSADVVAFLPLGTEVADVGPAGLEKTWARVRLADQREGWVMTTLTRAIDPRRRWPTVEAIVVERLDRRGDSFATRVELSNFVDRIASEATDPDVRARLAHHRLRAIGATAQAIPFKQATRDPYAGWIERHKTTVVYDEPGGSWMLSSEAVWQAYGAHAATAAGDGLAWLAATTGFPGECEGELTCYLRVRNLTYGEYLRKRPAGRHAAEAVEGIKSLAVSLAKPPKPREAFEFDRARDCKEYLESIESLRAAVMGTAVPDRDAAVQSLLALKSRCG